ncbi:MULTISPECIES: enoyl-ACP reductase FabI [Piscirickettsiaceae]|jgi:enoyl-[acyl-carrier protein] reductase I|uniref:Enoyl-[acyl-carrier-protein] reductase [NADH] n=1 Tax=Hydrogenovibrio thermophilus TaxID=265883 RepID=A0A410H3F0_9GAMM|nr:MULTISPECIES: enoyl-ACP reductase [Piscirickettsiaceae]AZR82122.1 enoyl-ACP reductase [Thiomicrospira sp. S5]QAB15340.1 enoyl-ACP reductase [Hydrogenovibrio thermophilus]
MGFLAGKKALIVGVANNKSIAYGIAKQMHEQGAEIALTYQTEKLKGRVEKIAEELGSSIVLPLDVTSDEQIDNVFAELGKQWDGLDILVHSVAFAPREELEGRMIDASTRSGFSVAHDISAYSLTALTKAGYDMLNKNNGSVLTVSYLGAERAVPNYNVMGIAKASLEATVRYLAADLGQDGIRVNAVSAGPIRTLAASGIKDFRSMLDKAAAATPLRRNVSIEEVGNTAAFLCSDLASGITGEITYVDGGYNTTASN